MKKAPLLLYLISALGFSQKIEIIKNDKGFKEIDFTKPKFNLTAEPVPKANGTYQMTHLMEVVCDDNSTGESGSMLQYINITNGVVGITSDLLKRWEGNKESIEGIENLHYWAILPNMTQRMFVTAPETGKTLIEMTAGDGMNNMTMARFDAKNLGDIFWTTAKKIKSVPLPKKLIETGKMTEGNMMLDVYEYVDDEGKVQIWLKDLGIAEGQYAALKNNYAVTGLGGTGWILNRRNNHVYLVFQVNDGDNTKGCRLTALYPKPHSFSGAGYKPMGDMMLGKIKENQQEENNSIDSDLAEKLRDEKDLQLIALYKEKAKIEKDFHTKVMESNANAALLNDASEITRSTAEFATNPETMYKMADIELRIKAREIEIQLNETQDPDLRTRLNKDLNCNRKQQNLWLNYRTDAKKLKEKMKGLEQYEQMEKMGVLMADYQQRLLTLCQ
jgi:hypothetical protein